MDFVKTLPAVFIVPLPLNTKSGVDVMSVTVPSVRLPDILRVWLFVLFQFALVVDINSRFDIAADKKDS